MAYNDEEARQRRKEHALAVAERRKERQRERRKEYFERKRLLSHKIIPTQVEVFSEKKRKMVTRNVNLITCPKVEIRRPFNHRDRWY